MTKVHENGSTRLAKERWEFAGQLWRALRSAGRRAAELSIQGATTARAEQCLGAGGEAVVKACPGCGSLERRDFRKNGSYRRKLVTFEGVVEVRVPRLRCRCGKSIPLEQLGFARRRRHSFDFLAMVLELVACARPCAASCSGRGGGVSGSPPPR